MMNKFPPLFKFILSEKATAPKVVRNLSLLLAGGCSGHHAWDVRGMVDSRGYGDGEERAYKVQNRQEREYQRNSEPYLKNTAGSAIPIHHAVSNV
ncbi:hypothetical protein K443DRAFT_511138 [Laccaria amethystina LaAM-08-1]|jgi:hypothetical protein|uniref:Uncharacterized protein n=1 Tax=Laccaria amethystina LaAM-08-1 TaxID=1095629 RepID=A0A0C9WMA4_9AGAR|nr:hypothetical protein K443DRAFT_511138 [Laccaria amethystina LaAM-08-1]